MKILQLNVWTGRLKGALERFVRENEADVICMQEAVWSEDAPGVVNYVFDSVDKLMVVIINMITARRISQSKSVIIA